MTEPSMCGLIAALCQITFTTSYCCYYRGDVGNTIEENSSISPQSKCTSCH